MIKEIKNRKGYAIEDEKLESLENLNIMDT